MTTAAEHNTSPFNIGMFIFDKMTNLDFVGPADIFARIQQAKVTVIGKTTQAVTTDSGCRVIPELALSDAPQFDLLFIGGGPGTTVLMEDEEVLDFFRRQAPNAKWITSVCTGALVLGAAGLLRGYKAATHWTAMDILPVLGAEPVYERVVIDRNRATGGGVTAGIDFGLTLVARLWGEERAQLIQLGTEYNPHPPFNSGSPATAPENVIKQFRAVSANTHAARLAAAIRAAAKLTENHIT